MKEDHDLDVATDALNRVAATFLAKRSRKRPRAKPSRCLGCGRVTRHVFCADCRKRRAEERS